MSRALRFTKMHGAGNDYVVLDGIQEELPPIPPLAARICDRHFGIGADQLLVARLESLQDREPQLFLGVEQVIEAPLAHTGQLADLVDRGRGISLGQHQGQGRLE